MKPLFNTLLIVNNFLFVSCLFTKKSLQNQIKVTVVILHWCVNICLIHLFICTHLINEEIIVSNYISLIITFIQVWVSLNLKRLLIYSITNSKVYLMNAYIFIVEFNCDKFLFYLVTNSYFVPVNLLLFIMWWLVGDEKSFYKCFSIHLKYNIKNKFESTCWQPN